MDFVNDDELDYEEDGFEDDSAKNASQNCEEDKVNESDKSVNKEPDISRCDEEYLQIDFSEDEENFISDEVPLETVSCKNPNARKAGEKGGEEDKEKEISSEKEHFTRNNNNGKKIKNAVHDGETNSKVGRSLTPLFPQLEFRKKVKTSVGPEPVKKPMCNNQLQSLEQDFANRKSTFKLSNLDTKQQEQNSQDIRSINNRFSNHCGMAFNTGSPKFPIQGRQIFSRNMRHKKFKFHLQDNKMSNPNMFDGNLNVSAGINQKSHFDQFQSHESSECLKRRFFCNQKTSNIDRDRKGSLIPKPPYNSLQEDERKLLQLKKEARLKRFIHDDLMAKERQTFERNELNSTSEFQEPSQDDLQISDGQKFISDSFLSLKEQNNNNSVFNSSRDSLPKVKPDINKELLLKKKNPFDKNMNILHRNKIVEYQTRGAKEGNPQTKLRHSIQQELLKEEGQNEEERISNGIFKPELNSHVNFVRTVSKSFEELFLKTGPTS